MNEMLNSVGKKILGNGNVEYEEVVKKQFEIIIDFFGDQLVEMLAKKEEPESPEISDEQKVIIATLIYDEILMPTIQFPAERGGRRKFVIEYNLVIKDRINSLLEERNIPVQFKMIEAVRLNSIFKNKVQIFMNGADDRNKLCEKIASELWFILL